MTPGVSIHRIHIVLRSCWFVISLFVTILLLVFMDTLSDINWHLLSNCNCLVMLVVCRLFSYYSKSMQALKALLIFALLYRSHQDGPRYRGVHTNFLVGPCNTTKECYDVEHPAWERIQKMKEHTKKMLHVTHVTPKWCTDHAACKCFPAGSPGRPWGCSSQKENNCEKDSVCNCPFSIKFI